jgi:type IV fimbrial biogenesis protein FimT
MRSVGPTAGLTAFTGGTGTVRPRRSVAAGFSLIELMIAIAIVGILLLLGMPSLSTAVERAKLNSLAGFYLDGLRLARNGALQKNGASRFVLTQNANGQYDWTVDWCFPTSLNPCDTAGAAVWSTTAAAASGDINAGNLSYSVFRSASSQPPTAKVSVTLTDNAGNVGATLAIYYNAQGWVNTGVQPFLRRLRFDADASFNPNAATLDVRPAAIAINLSGVAERCDPLAAAADSRACSP